MIVTNDKREKKKLQTFKSPRQSVPTSPEEAGGVEEGMREWVLTAHTAPWERTGLALSLPPFMISCLLPTELNCFPGEISVPWAGSSVSTHGVHTKPTGEQPRKHPLKSDALGG